MRQFAIYNPNSATCFKSCETREDADAEAKRLTAKYGTVFGIYALVAKTVNPVPAIEIVEVKVQ